MLPYYGHCSVFGVFAVTMLEHVIGEFYSVGKSIYIKVTAKRLSAKFSRERPPIETKPSQIMDATAGLDVRGGGRFAYRSSCRGARSEKPRTNRLPSWIYGENVRFSRHAPMLPIQK